MRDLLQAFMEGEAAPSAECCHALRPFILGVRARPCAQHDGCALCWTSKQSMAVGVMACGTLSTACAATMIQPSKHVFNALQPRIRVHMLPNEHTMIP